MTFEDKFYKLVPEIRDYYKVVSKLEDAFGGIVLESLQYLPQTILEILQTESNRVWTDEIWDKIFNIELADDISDIFEEIMNLPEVKCNE